MGVKRGEELGVAGKERGGMAAEGELSERYGYPGRGRFGGIAAPVQWHGSLGDHARGRR